MRFIKIFFCFLSLISSFFTFSSVDTNNFDCLDGGEKFRYSISSYDIVECKVNTTMENNSFRIFDKKKSVSYIVKDVSKLMINGIINNNASDSVAYFSKDTGMCQIDFKFNYDNNLLYFLTKIPNGNKYCYVIDGYISGYLPIKINKELAISSYAVIKENKVGLYNVNNNFEYIKTNMYLIKGDLVEIVGYKNGWVKVMYNGKRKIIAWLPNSVF